MTQATMMDAWAKVGAEQGDPPMLLERDGDKSIYWMHGKKASMTAFMRYGTEQRLRVIEAVMKRGTPGRR